MSNFGEVELFCRPGSQGLLSPAAINIPVFANLHALSISKTSLGHLCVLQRVGSKFSINNLHLNPHKDSNISERPDSLRVSYHEAQPEPGSRTKGGAFCCLSQGFLGLFFAGYRGVLGLRV